MSGQKILNGLREAVAGDFARVTIDGQTWERKRPGAPATIPAELLAADIRQAWADDYPPELAAWEVKGRKAWRRAHLIELIARRLPQTQRQDFTAACMSDLASDEDARSADVALTRNNPLKNVNE